MSSIGISAPLVIFRADAAVRIGFGHVRRCRSLAVALASKGARVRFVMRRTDVGSVALDEDFPITWLDGVSCSYVEAPNIQSGSQWLSVGIFDDANEFCESVHETVSAVIVDHYGIDAVWHQHVAQKLGCPVVVIDDLGDRELAASLIVDHNVATDHASKYRRVNLTRCEVLGGPRYALLDPRFCSALRNPARDPVRSVGIFMGGADLAGLSLRVLHALRETVRFTGGVEIALTSSHPQFERLREIAEHDSATNILVNARDLSDFFGRHELHIGAGGGATWERCCVGAPTLAIVAAPNQRDVLLPLVKSGVVEVVEGVSTLDTELSSKIVELINQPHRRRLMSEKAMELVDGYGASRVATRVMELCKQ